MCQPPWEQLYNVERNRVPVTHPEEERAKPGAIQREASPQMQMSVLENELVPKFFNFCQATGVALFDNRRMTNMNNMWVNSYLL